MWAEMSGLLKQGQNSGVEILAKTFMDVMKIHCHVVEPEADKPDQAFFSVLIQTH